VQYPIVVLLIDQKTEEVEEFTQQSSDVEYRRAWSLACSRAQSHLIIFEYTPSPEELPLHNKLCQFIRNLAVSD